MSVLLVCMDVCTVCLPVSSLRFEVTDVSHYGCWGSNLCPLQEQQVLLPAEPVL